MITVHTVKELREAVQAARRSGKRIGFVPTMGNLHAGHISLIDAAKEQTDFVVSSIFVNPLQFDDQNDLARYPRTLPQDQEKLATANCDLLFAPGVDEMYPNGQAGMSKVTVPVVTDCLCGASRPGHFDGVATVVTKLFNMVQPDQAFFGEKDFQQVAVIRKFVADLNIPVAITSVATRRDSDGLALSSRNGYLTSEERAQAAKLQQTLQEIASALRQQQPIAKTLSAAKQRLQEYGFIPDYIEVRRANDLQEASQNDSEVVILAAAHLGKARLIDNISLVLNHNKV